MKTAKAAIRDRKTARRRAAILVLTLWIIVVLGLISASMLEDIFLELKLAKFQRDDFEAMCLARAGLARAVADLRNDMTMDRSGRTDPYDALGDIWARPDEDKVGRDNQGVAMGRGRYFVWVDDEAGKFDLDTVSRSPSLLRIVLQELGLPPKEVETVANAIFDYRDGDDQVTLTPGTTPAGAVKEDEYYSSLAAKESGKRWSKDDGPIYRCKNDRFSSVDELLSVYGVTPKMFYGVDPKKETLPGPIERLKARAEEARKGEARKRPLGLRDVLTANSAGALNINTADKFALRVVFRMVLTNPKLAEGAADKVLAFRKPDSRGNQSSEKAFHNIVQLETAAGLPPGSAERIRTAGNVTLDVRSDTYRISALGEVNQTQHLITAVVIRGYEVCQSDQLNPLFDKGTINSRLRDAFRRRHPETRGLIEQATVRVVQWQDQ